MSIESPGEDLQDQVYENKETRIPAAHKDVAEDMAYADQEFRDAAKRIINSGGQVTLTNPSFEVRNKSTAIYHEHRDKLKTEADQRANSLTRINDKDKAHDMALAGDKLRTDAANDRKEISSAREVADGYPDYEQIDQLGYDAEFADSIASNREKEAGVKYDQDKEKKEKQ